MSIFTEVKEQLKLRDVAEYYGLHTNRAGFTNCPFHQERTPSMKLYDDHFYCFGCQSSGDAITMVEKLFGLQPIRNRFGKNWSLRNGTATMEAELRELQIFKTRTENFLSEHGLSDYFRNTFIHSNNRDV
ncbi:MAG: hypothetical protein HDR09_03900 [Lachnospiraceae bacterium]|nr:hypothetical protein [Lachnospiraceae bacterium]